MSISKPILSTKPSEGLTTQEARRRMAEYGPNAIAEPRRHPVLVLLSKFWAPVPWMLELTIVLELVLRRTTEAAVIAFLLLFNSVLSFIQEDRAQGALVLLRKRLTVRARALRDGTWQSVNAEELVPGDLIHVRAGDVVPADLHIGEGQVQLDQSALTGESMPVEASAGHDAYAGSIVKRGEASGEVIATDGRTYFGRTAELVSTAKTVSHLGEVIFTIVKYLVAADSILVCGLLVFAIHTRMPLADTIPFALILLVASVPVALPATFTFATTLGAVELSSSGVLITRLSAIEEAAAMDVLCVDKTGTITQNRLVLAAIKASKPYSEHDLLHLAVIASDEATQDPLDLAIITSAREHHLPIDLSTRTGFVPFDPSTKRSEASFVENGRGMRVVKGAPHVIASLMEGAPDLTSEVAALAAHGYRVLAVGAGPEGKMELAGLLGLHDPPREDSRALVKGLGELGVRVVMVTGDDPATARAIAGMVGIGDRIATGEALKDHDGTLIDVFAGVFPEDKFAIVRSFQKGGHVCGMTGDGVNDAPALKQAEVGIAVAASTDVARAAASIVLTQPGLINVLDAVAASRRIYQRMLTYTLNKIIKTLEIAVFLSLGVMLTRVFVITPMLIVLLLFTNDFATMSIATDRVSSSRQPDRWQIGTLMLNGAALAVLILLLSFSLFFVGRDVIRLPLPQLQTLIFLMLVFSGQGTIYLVRERRHFWRSRPGRWLIVVSIADIALVSALAINGILMAPVAASLVAALFAVVAVYLAIIDLLKVRIFKALSLQ